MLENIWEITFFDNSYGYIIAPDISECVKEIKTQNWNQSFDRIVKIELMDNGLGPDVVHGRYIQV